MWRGGIRFVEESFGLISLFEDIEAVEKVRGSRRRLIRSGNQYGFTSSLGTRCWWFARGGCGALGSFIIPLED